MDRYDREESAIEKEKRAFRDFVLMTNGSPCAECVHRRELYCEFYRETLEEDGGYIYPTGLCTEDTYYTS